MFILETAISYDLDYRVYLVNGDTILQWMCSLNCNFRELIMNIIIYGGFQARVGTLLRLLRKMCSFVKFRWYSTIHMI